MIKLMLLAIVLTGSGVMPAQTPSRAELKKPLSEAVEKVLNDFVISCVPEKQKQLKTQMEEVVKTIDATVKLTDEEKRVLQEEAGKAVEEAVTNWRPLALVMMRTYLSRGSDSAAIRHIGMWKPEVAGPNEPVEDWTPPDEVGSWQAALKATLGEARLARWQEVDGKAKQAVIKEIDAHLERWVRESRGPMNEDLRAKIELMKKNLQLSDAQVTALNKVADSLLDRLSKAEKKRATGMLRTLPAEARESIMGRSYFYIRFDRPRRQEWEKTWEKAAAKVIPAELLVEWQKLSKAERSKAETELTEMIKPSEQQAEQQMEMVLRAEIDSTVMALNLNKERQEALEKLSKEAVQEAMKLARKGWLVQAENYTAAERKRVGGNVYFGINEEQQAIKLPVWTEGIKKLLSEEERTRMAAENKEREQRTGQAVASACLTEMDKTLAMTQEQRKQLEPLLVETMLPLVEQRRQQYWSFNATQLFQNAGKVKEEMVRAILDEVQWKHWRELIMANSGSSRKNPMPNMNDSHAEVQDMEPAISQHLYKMFLAEREKTLAAIMPQVEEATRLLGLPEQTVARLTTAAKGAVESSLEYWRQNTERYVRQSVQMATPKNILQALAGTERVNFSRNESEVLDTERWKAALKTTLNEVQQEKLRQAASERHDYRLKAMAAMSISELDRRRKLSPEQCAKIETAIQKVLADYLPDIERSMPMQWFLQYYYALIPMAGVTEKEMEAILTPEQWKLCKERDLPDAMQYWEGIKNNHEERMKQGGRNANRLMNGGVMFEQ